MIPHISGIKSKLLYIGIVLAILGVMGLGTSMTMISNYPEGMLGIVLSGILVHTGIGMFAIDFGQGKELQLDLDGTDKRARFDWRVHLDANVGKPNLRDARRGREVRETVGPLAVLRGQHNG